MFWPAVWMLIVLAFGWGFTAFIFSSPSRVAWYRYIMYVPALATIIILLCQGRIIELILNHVIIIPYWKGSVFAIIYPFFVIALCVVICLLLGYGNINQSKMHSLFTFPDLATTSQAIFACLGEEIGWRGYLLPTLTVVQTPVVATCIVGVCWGMWHTPLIYYLSKTNGSCHPARISLIQFFAVLVASFPMSYTFYTSHSVIPSTIFHFIWNLYNVKILGNIYRNLQGIVEGPLEIVNGEGIIGIIAGLPFLIWFLYVF